MGGKKVATDLFRSNVKEKWFWNAEPWSHTSSSRRAFEFDKKNYSLHIKQDGLYLLYVQVCFHI